MRATLVKELVKSDCGLLVGEVMIQVINRNNDVSQVKGCLLLLADILRSHATEMFIMPNDSDVLIDVLITNWIESIETGGKALFTIYANSIDAVLFSRKASNLPRPPKWDFVLETITNSSESGEQYQIDAGKRLLNSHESYLKNEKSLPKRNMPIEPRKSDGDTQQEKEIIENLGSSMDEKAVLNISKQDDQLLADSKAASNVVAGSRISNAHIIKQKAIAAARRKST